MSTIISTDQAFETLLAVPRPVVALFFKDGDGVEVSRFFEQKWPQAWSVVAVDVDQASETYKRMGIQNTPAVAVLHRQCLLAVDVGCDPDACERVVRWAHGQLREFHRA